MHAFLSPVYVDGTKYLASASVVRHLRGNVSTGRWKYPTLLRNLYQTQTYERRQRKGLMVAALKEDDRDSQATWKVHAQRGLISLLAAATVFTSAVLPSPAISIRADASLRPEIFSVQQTLVEAWAIVKETFVDPGFNDNDWDEVLFRSLEQSTEAVDASEAYNVMLKMVGLLGDKFTRVINPKEYNNFQISNEGELQGVGMYLGQLDNESKDIIVLKCINSGPAQQSGILAGDIVEEVDRVTLQGLSPSEVSTLLQGKKGTVVSVKIRREVEGLADTGSDSKYISKIIKVKRAQVVLNPVESRMYSHLGEDGREHRVGYIHLLTFSTNSSEAVYNAVEDMKAKGVDEYILDLRDNGGGLVEEGLSVAAIWLDPGTPLVTTLDRDGDRTQLNLASSSQPVTKDPLVVLVNGGTASASEILTGALMDSGRAEVLGTKTYGKGRIQSVYQLKDGSALFVTVALYQTPNLQTIDKVGINPKIQCTDSTSSLLEVSEEGNDDCIKAAEGILDLKGMAGVETRSVSSF